MTVFEIVSYNWQQLLLVDTVITVHVTTVNYLVKRDRVTELTISQLLSCDLHHTIDVTIAVITITLSILFLSQCKKFYKRLLVLKII